MWKPDIFLHPAEFKPTRGAVNGGASSSPAQHCAYCAGEPVIYNPYSSQHLCEKHFCEGVERRFKLTIRTHKMLSKNDHIGIALSGGKDSSVMLHLFRMLSKSLPLKLTAITIDEGIKGYRPHTLAVAKKEAKRLRVPLIVSSFEKEYGFSLDRAVAVSKKAALPCSFCGVFRRHLLNRAAKKAGVKKLAIGHNLDDMAQTFLMNVFRNDTAHISRMMAFEGAPANRGFVPRIRPLMDIPEKEIALYSVLKGIPIHFQQCPYATTALRQKVRDMLNSFEDSQPGTKIRVAKSALEISRLLPAASAASLRECKECGEPSSSEYCMACRMVEGLREKTGRAKHAGIGKSEKMGKAPKARQRKK